MLLRHSGQSNCRDLPDKKILVLYSEKKSFGLATNGRHQKCAASSIRAAVRFRFRTAFCWIRGFIIEHSRIPPGLELDKSGKGGRQTKYLVAVEPRVYSIDDEFQILLLNVVPGYSRVQQTVQASGKELVSGQAVALSIAAGTRL